MSSTPTGKGEGSIWKVVADDTAPSRKGHVLAQTAESPGAVFNLCVADDTNLKDVEVTVAFKANKGNKDQGGGIVAVDQRAQSPHQIDRGAPGGGSDDPRALQPGRSTGARQARFRAAAARGQGDADLRL